MKPYVICHMMSSLDGHALTDGWDRAVKKSVDTLYETLAERFEGDAWLCGRVTMQEISHGEDFPRGLASTAIARENYFAKRDARQYAISIDPHGKVAWKTNEALNSHVVEIVSEQVSDDFLAYLRSIEVSYVFGGKTDIDLAAVLKVLGQALGIKRLLVEGGPHVSGAFVQAGLVDEVSVLISPLIDGRGTHPVSFEFDENEWKMPTYLSLTSAEVQAGGVIWARYTVAA